MLDYLSKEGINKNLISEIEQYQKFYKVNSNMKYRITVPNNHYYGKDIWEEAITVLVCSENLLLVDPKTTNKNVLTENLAAAFGRPVWDIFLHINTDSSYLIGTDTFENEQVVIRHGPIYEYVMQGGFGILD